MTQTSDLVHFFSWTTGVSLELPVGYEGAGSDASSASYAVIDDDGEVTDDPRLQVRVATDLGDAGDDVRSAAVARLVDELASRGEEVERREREVDGEPALTVVVRGGGGHDGLVHATVVASGRRLLSIVGLVADEAGLAVLDAAVDTVRLVEVDAA